MKKKIVLVSSVLIFCIFVWAAAMHHTSSVMDVSRISEQAYQKIRDKRTEMVDPSRAKLFVNGVEAAWEQTEGRYYISQSLSEGYWKGVLTAQVDGQEVSAAFEENDGFQDLNHSIQEGTVFYCLVYTDSEYAEIPVLFTGMPMLSIDGTMGEDGTTIRLLDPVFAPSGEYDVLDSHAYYNIRGNASKRFEKIGYRLDLLNDDGSTDRKESLLGMRKDNNWQLKAMYSDRSKLRDKLSIELWNQIADRTETKTDAGCKMEYVELILNGEYQGLYGLVEPTDYKSLNLDKTKDLIYKVGNDEWPDDDLFAESNASQSFSCGGINIKKGGKDWYDGIWTPFQTFWNSGYNMESESDLATLYRCIDRQNFINYDLYYNAIAGMDNRFKNIFYSTEMHADGTFTIRRIPWDQNYSWGDDFEQGEDKDIKNIRYNPELTTRWLNEEVFRNMQAFDTALPEDMKTTWDSWRADFLTEDYWKSYAREQMKYLVESGAFGRDTARWPDSENVEGTTEIEAYIDTRFTFLDNYLADLTINN